jgi:hypothetical protein
MKMLSPRARQFGIVALFASFTLAFFWRIIFLPEVYFPPGGDFVSFNFPQAVFGASALRNGTFPLWNPYVMTGQPYVADPNIGALYPPRVLLAFVSAPSYRDLEFFLIAHVFLSGVLMYALARDLGAPTSGAIIAGIAFMFSGFMLGQLEHPNIVISATWLAPAWMFLRRALIARQWANAIGAGLFLALSVLGGHQQFALMMILWMLIWVIVHSLTVARREWRRAFASFALMLFSASAASAAQILPAVELIGESTRSALGAAEASALNLPPQGWITLIAPNYFGAHAQNAQSVWQGYGNWNEASGFVGVIPLLLALLAIIRRAPHPEIFFLASIALVALLLAAGDLTPVYQWTTALIPPMRWVRVPARFIFWFDLAIPLLTAFGCDYFRAATAQARFDARAAWLLGALALIATTFARGDDFGARALVLAGWFTLVLFQRWLRGARALLLALLISFVALDLFAAQATRIFTTHNPTARFQHPAIFDLWSRAGADWRVDRAPEALAEWEPLAGLIYPMPMASGLPWNPFDLQSVSDYTRALDRDSSAYDFLSARFLIVPRGMELSGKWQPRALADSTLAVYENTRAIPRAQIVFDSIIEPDRARALAMLQRGEIDLRRTVLLETGNALSNLSDASPAPIAASAPNHLVIHVQNSRAGYLVLSDAFYPGWRAWVDGVATPVVRANYAFRAIFVPAGARDIRFEFESRAWQIGLAISLALWGGVGAWSIITAKRLFTCARRDAIK